MPQNTFASSGTDLVGHCIDNGRIQFLSVLGIGAYGVVYLAVDLHAPTPVYLAVKCLLRAGLDSRQKHFQRREIALHQLASRHPNVVSLHKVFEEGDYVYVIMDYCNDGDLFGMITEQQRYLGYDALIKKVFLQIVDAVQYLHSLGIFHRDLKPENILCTKDGERICIADFGLATSERTSTDFGCGSTFYLSPECQGGLFERVDQYGTEGNDIWSLGVILVNLTCGRNPWRQACPDDETFRAFVNNPDFLKTILPISPECNRILKSIFALEPSKRISLSELRRQIMAVGSFTLTDDELVHAHAAARAAAAAVRPMPIPQVVHHQQDRSDGMLYIQHNPQTSSKVTQKLHPHVWDTSGYRSSGRTYRKDHHDHRYLESDIDFTLTSTASSSIHIHHGGRPSTDTPSLESEMIETDSRSSSSCDQSLPPTPEFHPADSPCGGDTEAGSSKTPAEWGLSTSRNLRLAPFNPAEAEFVL